jgi:hypothetical protein
MDAADSLPARAAARWSETARRAGSRSRIVWTWAVVLPFWLSPQMGNGAIWQAAAAFAVATGMFIHAVREQRTGIHGRAATRR